jgi:hypothetical protein
MEFLSARVYAVNFKLAENLIVDNNVCESAPGLTKRR